MIRVLFLCTGNICRSAYAERRARHLVPDHDVVSAGTHAMRGWGVDEAMAEELEARGGTAAGFSAQQLTEPLARSASLLLCATREHRAFVTDAWPDLEPRTFVMKPYARELAAADLAAWSPLPAADASALTRADDIADPYRMGQPDAARAADEIDAILAQIIGTPATD
jgi:protein-tyrosine-phosphatase